MAQTKTKTVVLTVREGGDIQPDIVPHKPHTQPWIDAILTYALYVVQDTDHYFKNWSVPCHWSARFIDGAHTLIKVTCSSRAHVS